MTRNFITSSDILKGWGIKGVTADIVNEKNALILFILALFGLSKHKINTACYALNIQPSDKTL
jgi:hypothetical protein